MGPIPTIVDETSLMPQQEEPLKDVRAALDDVLTIAEYEAALNLGAEQFWRERRRVDRARRTRYNEVGSASTLSPRVRDATGWRSTD